MENSDIRPCRRYSKRIPRCMALSWAARHITRYPDNRAPDITLGVYYDWGFVRGLDGVMYLANCLDRGITEDEVLAHRRAIAWARAMARGKNE